jgi:hypothetical protein
MQEYEQAEVKPFYVCHSNRIMRPKVEEMTLNSEKEKKKNLPGITMIQERVRSRRSLLGDLASSVDTFEPNNVQRYDVARYYNDPTYRIYDSFDMIDFYGRKKACIEMGRTLTKDDRKWYQDQAYRLQ